MLSIRKLQQSNRVLRGSGKELLALASPNLSNLAPSRLAASSSLPSHVPSHVPSHLPSPASPPSLPPSSGCRHRAGPLSGSVAGAIRERELRV
jgi:hypothetical protein